MAEGKPEGWDEAIAVTGRPNDVPLPNTTFGERAKARQPQKKAVQSAENKAVAADKPARKSASK